MLVFRDIRYYLCNETVRDVGGRELTSEMDNRIWQLGFRNPPPIPDRPKASRETSSKVLPDLTELPFGSRLEVRVESCSARMVEQASAADGDQAANKPQTLVGTMRALLLSAHSRVFDRGRGEGRHRNFVLSGVNANLRT